MSKYQKPRTIRTEPRNLAGTFKGGKLAPVMVVPFKGSESGTVSQRVHFELDPVAGRLITEIRAKITSVFVPAQAIDAIKNPDEDFAGSADVYRQKLLSGTPVFGLEPESEVSKRLGIVPRSVGGTKYVNEISRLAHNSAVNYLRKRKYVKAAQLDKTNAAMTPALIDQTILERMNGVLDPEDRVNGAVDFEFGNVKLPVEGIYGRTGTYASVKTDMRQTGGDAPETVTGKAAYDSSVVNQIIMTEDPDNPGYPGVFANMDGVSGGVISLTDFYQAEQQDRIVREMRKLVDDNSEYGEEILTRWAHGLSVDMGKIPFVVYEKTTVFGRGIKVAMDGDNMDKTQSNHEVGMEFTVPIPPSEFGGILITFVSVLPDETLASQPHPILSSEWGVDNFVADEMAIDPVPVTIRELNADCAAVDEETIVLYIGNNHLQKNYLNYGFNRQLDTTTVAAKTAIWQLEVPMSVTPESILYPEDLDQYPFVDQLAEICTYNITSMARINTPTIMGPSPVEELAEIETADIFEDAP